VNRELCSPAPAPAHPFLFQIDLKHVLPPEGGRPVNIKATLSANALMVREGLTARAVGIIDASAT
jgi:hypothetical protein